ncbi:MAG: hypothetical protein INQ03_17245 [Candidatus Heimdallarchaeota archaeon]|nr:hypothetical protein [Candidatus Heimdallarchaeota archaeon]
MALSKVHLDDLNAIEINDLGIRSIDFDRLSKDPEEIRKFDFVANIIIERLQNKFCNNNKHRLETVLELDDNNLLNRCVYCSKYAYNNRFDLKLYEIYDKVIDKLEHKYSILNTGQLQAIVKKNLGITLEREDELNLLRFEETKTKVEKMYLELNKLRHDGLL